MMMGVEHWWNGNGRGSGNTRGKTCPSVTASKTDLITTNLRLNPGLLRRGLATDSLSCGTANLERGLGVQWQALHLEQRARA